MRIISKNCPKFQMIDRALQRKYRLKNPYWISKKFLQKNSALEIHAYGETPITTLLHIVSECKISSNDIVIEMGAGRGRGAFFFAEFVKCKVIGYEQIPSFVAIANDIAMKHRCSSFEMRCSDMFQADFSDASVIYLYGSMLSDEEVIKLIDKFPHNVKIITVSYPLHDYSENFQTVKAFPGSFPWGETMIYWNQKI